jgi:uncharacterized protein YidB (DUF937 family)
MGMLDGLIGSVIGNMMGGAGAAPGAAPGAAAGGGANPLLNIAFQLMQQQGGLQGLLGSLTQGGMAQQAASWVGQGQNQGVTGDMLKSVLGSGVLGNLGAQHGMNENEVSSGLASMLPELINQMTPQGQVPHNANDMISQAMGMLLKK